MWRVAYENLHKGFWGLQLLTSKLVLPYCLIITPPEEEEECNKSLINGCLSIEGIVGVEFMMDSSTFSLSVVFKSILVYVDLIEIMLIPYQWFPISFYVQIKPRVGIFPFYLIFG